MSDLQAGQSAFNSGEYLDAFAYASRHLTGDFDDPRGLMMAAAALEKAGYYGVAHTLYEKTHRLYPQHPDPLNSMGHCIQKTGDYVEALKLFKRANMLDEKHVFSMNNIGLCHLNMGRWEQAEKWARKTVAATNDLIPAYDNLSMALLAQGRFEEGWSYAEKGIGSFKRAEKRYGSEPRWQGPQTVEDDGIIDPMSIGANGTVICYGEQGIGDEVLFSSCLPDFCADVEYPVIDTMPRLKGLFARSFPKADVIGSRYEDIEIKGADAHVSMAVLPKWYRPNREAFDRPPHLVADPERRLMVRALLDSMPGVKVGIAWNGGLPDTRQHDRSTEFKGLYDDLKDLPATFISLEYKGDGSAAIEEIGGAENVRHFPHLTNTKDYDDTAALVAELDCVVSVTTSVVHLAGGLGVPVFILVPEPPSWKYGLGANPGEGFYWWNSARLIRQTNREWDLTPARRWINERHEGQERQR